MTKWTSVPFLEAFSDDSAGSKKLQQSEYQAAARFPIIDQGEKPIAGYTDDETYLSHTKLPVVVFGDHTRRFKFVGQPFVVGADGVKILAPKSEVDAKYGFHYLRSISLPSAGYSRHFKFLKDVIVPLPPLPEQRRIADILDRADDLRAKRRRALKLLGEIETILFDHVFGPLGSQETVGLLDICKAQSGGTPAKSNPEFWDGGIPWFSPKDMKSSDLWDSIDHVTEPAVAESTLKRQPENTVAIVVRGMILAHSFPVAVLRVPGTINQDMKALVPHVQTDPQFLAHAIRAQTNDILGLVSTAGHGTKRLDAESLASIRIPKISYGAQIEFGARVAQLQSVATAHRTELAKLDDLFAALQHRAFSGQL